MINVPSQLTQDVLVDVSSTGHVRPWAHKKSSNMLLAMAYDQVNEGKAARLRDCATALYYLLEGDTKRLAMAQFCRVRLCPICAWRRSLKASAQVYSVIDAMRCNMRCVYCLLTLTVRNCAPDDLGATLDHLGAALHRFLGYKAVKDVVLGFYRGLEITHNISKDTYHPHYHILLALPAGYFISDDYLSHDRWQALWRKAARLDYDPQVDIRRVKGNSASAVAEVAKYAVKDADYIIPYDWDLTVDTVQLLDKVLHKRRFAAFGGVMAEWHAKLHLDDLDDGDLINVDDDPIVDLPPVDVPLVPYFWVSGYRQYIRG